MKKYSVPKINTVVYRGTIDKAMRTASNMSLAALMCAEVLIKKKKKNTIAATDVKC